MKKFLLPITIIIALVTIACKKKTEDTVDDQSIQNAAVADTAYFATV